MDSRAKSRSEPVTPLTKIQRTPSCTTTPGGNRIKIEKILVTVRMRPLSPREQAKYDLIAWECQDDHTIAYSNPTSDRSSASYSFDKVFGPKCSTHKVYEEGAKDVALSALSGINATIFAYGQTSSGKTFTMRGITDYAVKDIYEHMKCNPERDFLLKMSALEIYNETVVDLLNRSGGPLRLLDDPEKGTIVEKLVEEVVKDSQHLRELIGICEAQRQVGETALNDKSSRSHQIIKLTIESRQRETGRVKSFMATLNLVDLAGSERASQTNSDGLRLKEGSHINRSLLTLTQVIRKLSVGRRIGHIPYRESKLTRILQSSLGGNARTAIICTLSPAMSHFDQSRNTLSFATSAKEVTNTARVNMVVSDQQRVKELQKEVARLEAELRSPEPVSTSSSSLKALLIEKDMKIQEMEKEMNKLKRERDLAQTQLQLEKSSRKEPKGSCESSPSHGARKRLAFSYENASLATPQTRKRNNTVKKKKRRQSIASTDPSMLMQEIRKLGTLQRQLGEDANRAADLLTKEMSSNKLGTQEAAEVIERLLSEIKNMQVRSFTSSQELVVSNKADLKEEIVKLNCQGSTIECLEKKLEDMQNALDKMVNSSFTVKEINSTQSKKKKMAFNLSNSPNMSSFIRAPCSPLPSSSSSRKVMDEIGNKIGDQTCLVSGDNVTGSYRAATPLKGDMENASRDSTPVPRKSSSISVKRMQKLFKNAAEENIRSIRAYVTELKERVAKLQYQKQLLVCQVLQLEENEGATSSEAETAATIDQSPVSWQLQFEEQRKQIVMLWHLCHVSLVHRTQFYLLFRGEEADQIYMEVELRRLTWLEQHLSDLGNASPALLGDEPATYVSSSIRALKQEREYLAKRVSIKLTPEERETVYMKWEVPPEGKQKRRLQLVNKLWTDPHNMQYVHDSAQLVAKLVGFCESGEVTKEMFELNFKSPIDKKTWMGWSYLSNLLHL